MGFSTAMSVGAYSVVLAESLAAVGLSTLIPAAFVAAARAAKATTDTLDPPPDDALVSTDGLNTIVPAGPVAEIVGHIADETEVLHLLVPKKADIKASFEMQASESYAMDAEVGVNAEVVGVHVGYSGLYSTATQMKVTLDLHYEVAHFLLRRPEA